MLKFINSDIISNSYLRILLLISIISGLSYLHYKKINKKLRWTGSRTAGPIMLNYFANAFIFFVIPKFFDIDNLFISVVINLYGIITSTFFSFLKTSLFGINILLIIISQYINIKFNI